MEFKPGQGEGRARAGISLSRFAAGRRGRSCNRDTAHTNDTLDLTNWKL